MGTYLALLTIEGLLKEIGDNYITIQYEGPMEGIAFVYALLQYARCPLILHGHMDIIPSLRLVERCKGRKIIVEEKNPLHKVIRNLDGFNTFILVGYKLNDFENEFLRQMCKANRKAVLLFSEAPGTHNLKCDRGCYTFLGREMVMESYELKIREHL